MDKFWINNTIITPFGKRIDDVQKHYALNYLVQSTAAELLLKQSLKINELLRQRGASSHIAFLIHDSVVLDMTEGDLQHIDAISHLFGSTNFGKFLINRKKGKNLGGLYEF